MDWHKTVYALVIILLYLPLVFLGANVFFPDYTEYPAYECPARPLAEPTVDQAAAQDECQREYNEKTEAYRTQKRSYDAWKYFFIVIVNLIALLIALAPLNVSIVYGLFVGSTLASFFSTWIYFDAKSLPGFIVLVVIFAVTIFFIQRQRETGSRKKKR